MDDIALQSSTEQDDKLLNIELVLIRRRLGITMPEATVLIGKCSENDWCLMEFGKMSIPEHINNRFKTIRIIYQSTLDILMKSPPLKLPPFATYKEFMVQFPHSSTLCWRIYQAALAETLILSNKHKCLEDCDYPKDKLNLDILNVPIGMEN